MSLETSLELNNQLLTQHNALLERLITALASGVALHPDTEAQEYRETVSETKQENTFLPPVTLDDLEFSDIIALAGFYPEPVALSAEMFQRAVEYRDAENEKRVVQIDALDCALCGVKRALSLHKDVLLRLSRDIISYWDDLTTIDARRTFAERWLDAKPGERDTVRPKKASSKDKQQVRKGPFYLRNDDGKIVEVATENQLKSHIDSGYVEIHKVEYLQLKETADITPDYTALRKTAEGLILQLAKGGYRNEAVAILSDFGAHKLGSVADENLAELINKAETVLED